MRQKYYSFKTLLLFEDEDYLVVNKPAFLSSLEDRREKVNLLKLARGYHADAKLCHRLDKDTSGVMILAKNPLSYRSMSIHFEKRHVLKIYHAVVDGIHNLRNCIVNTPISVIQGSIARIDHLKGKNATTVINSIKGFRQHTLLECKPVSGRMHQVRVHLSSIGAPITGDLAYGGALFFLSSVKKDYRLGKYEEERPLMSRLALHAQKITFPLMDNSTKQIEAPYPKDFEVLLKQLEKNI